MEKSDIHLGDLQRILLGTAPAAFLVETLLRTLIVYLYVLITAQFLGKRMKGQLSVTEMAIMLMIGAVASVAMQVPDRDGIMQLHTMAKAPITRQEIFAELRGRNIAHLGRVDRMYFEACGIRSVYESPSGGRPGLSVWPAADTAYKQQERHAPEARQACTNCGQVQDAGPTDRCSTCRQTSWTNAVI